MTALGVSDPVVEAMVNHALFELPNEACGLLAGREGRVSMVYCLDNTDQAPDRYTIDPAAIFGASAHAERNGWEILGVFHSHPKGHPTPSAVDRQQAADSQWVYVIVGMLNSAAPTVRAFRFADPSQEVELVNPTPGR